MIINTGQRTDIPAFYPLWFANRIKEGFVCVRNPYDPTQVSRYLLRPDVVDVIGFCTKNPKPFFPYLDLVKEFGQFWYVTITPYGKDIEPAVPNKEEVLKSFKYLSKRVGINSIGWRYDPIFVSDKYTVDFHLSSFDKMARELEGYTKVVVISFIDLYEKVKRNFPEVKVVSEQDRINLGKEIISIASSHGMVVKPCGEGNFLEKYGADCSGCMTISQYESAIGKKINAPKTKPSRKECACYLSGDIGAYDTCAHLCRYCYANNDVELVAQNRKKHDPKSPFLIGNYRPEDVIHDVVQKSWVDGQMNIFDYLNCREG
ncbi:protein of unknown function [Butyrivibrio hungatei DSM 14810]|uniref:DUF1848 domain-containing protein n=1 Tax=Butyrivibrio hungatei DSM 14810 TaxID=1121132 RepID=A0A1M7S500_9FIRM|nr:DUF1848 domain-containing protein [Butyrivibrio hungatei]SHN53536.1 protein of unknown function [Butyrivibrio hungatei DSM 14810]